MIPVLTLGGNSTDIRAVSSPGEVRRYFQDFPVYCVAMEVTKGKLNGRLIIVRHSLDLCRELEVIVENLKEDASYYLHRFDMDTINQFLADGKKRQCYIDIMRLRAKALGLMPMIVQTGV